MSEPSPAPVAERRHRRAGRTGRILVAVGIALVLVLAGYATYAYLSSRPPPGTTRLTVLTYPSLFGGTNCASSALSAVLAPFEAAEHVVVTLVCPSGTLVNALLGGPSATSADVVIGLDEVTAPQAEADHLILPYAPPRLADVPPALTSELGPDHAVTPYEWGYLGIDFNASFDERTHGAVANSSFENFSANSSWASSLMIEDPATDITGEEFLLWEIAFYQSVLHADWTTWWKTVAPHLQTAPDWSTAFSAFTTPPNSPPMVVSYTTDPAYAAAYGPAGAYNSTVTHWNGTAYGWRTVYGMGVVNGSAHVGLAEALIDFFLNGSVQSQIPTNEWEYPANATVPLPPVFAAAANISQVVPLNDAIGPAAIAANLTGPNGWLSTWQGIENQYG